MYVLHSFTYAAVHYLGQEQFLGLYLSAGVLSSFGSYLYKILTHRPGEFHGFLLPVKKSCTQNPPKFDPTI
jgi:membrane associated rhomboid family serine protease